MFLEISQNSQENTCARVSFLTKLQAWGCEFCKISKNTFFFTEYLWATASGQKEVNNLDQLNAGWISDNTFSNLE